LIRNEYNDDSARLVRYLSAFVLLIYGFAKVNGSQFTILDSELDKPLRQVSGFWLTWYYFGYSSFYGAFVAFAQITGAMMLTLTRTTLLGSCILAAVLTNVVLIDVFYSIDLGATLIALILACAMMWLISKKRLELLALFWPRSKGHSVPNNLIGPAWIVRAVMLLSAFGFTYWVANYNNRAPTPLDGVWEVIQIMPRSVAVQLPKKIFFERNRAYMCVFRFPNGEYVTHHFEIDRSRKQIRIWKQWLDKGDLIFAGTYQLSGTALTVNGLLTDFGHLQMRLEQR
jgi:hypothetical protein